MEADKVFAKVELISNSFRVKLNTIVDTGASISVISKRLADKLNSFIPFPSQYQLKTANEGGRINIIGLCVVKVIFVDVEVPGYVAFNVAENLADYDLIIGRTEIDAWDITFTDKGPYPRKVPIELRII